VKDGRKAVRKGRKEKEGRKERTAVKEGRKQCKAGREKVKDLRAVRSELPKSSRVWPIPCPKSERGWIAVVARKG
jgi:hypothetical protein